MHPDRAKWQLFNEQLLVYYTFNYFGMNKLSYNELCLGEFFLLIRFYFHLEVYSQPKRTVLRILQYLLLGLIVGLTYLDPHGAQMHAAEKISVLITSRLFTTLASLPFLASYLATDRKLIVEGLSGVKMPIVLVVVAKLVIYITLRQLLLLVYVVIVYPLTGLRPGLHRVLCFIAILWTHQFAKSALGFFVSACFVSKHVTSYQTIKTITMAISWRILS